MKKMAVAQTVLARRQEEAAVDSRLASEIKALLARGDKVAASARFEAIIERHQRRATRIAYYYLRDPAEVDEAVQDAFFKAFVHLPSFREERYFELWFTRIVVNGCLDRLKAQSRRRRWIVPTSEHEQKLIDRRPAREPSPETALLHGERRTRLLAAVERLPRRQRAVVVLSQFEEHSTRDVAGMLDLTEATVRVHLFRAIQSLRKLLQGERWLSDQYARAANVGGKS